MTNNAVLQQELDVNFYKYVVSQVRMQENGDRRYNAKRLALSAINYTALVNQETGIPGITIDIIMKGIKTFNKLTKSTITTSVAL